jgi:general secretion pathway protein A
MYESYYKLSAKPFQLKPDPSFFYGSKGHRRAMAYLEYGLSQGEGFIVITGEIGAGKTTLVRNLFRKLQQNVVAAHIANTHVDADDIVRMVAAAFDIPFQDVSKAAILASLEQFFRRCDAEGKRILLVVDEAQNLSVRAVEELRMLSNFQTDEHSLLQTFLLGQPEFRKILLSPSMQQLHQRVTATCHLGPLDVNDTRSYIEHRLRTAGWTGTPAIEDSAFAKIFDHTKGIPRKINTLCDRVFLHGYLEELTIFTEQEVATVIKDILEEAGVPAETGAPLSGHAAPPAPAAELSPQFNHINERLGKMERAVMSVLDAMRRLLPSSSTRDL